MSPALDLQVVRVELLDPLGVQLGEIGDIVVVRQLGMKISSLDAGERDHEEP